MLSSLHTSILHALDDHPVNWSYKDSNSSADQRCCLCGDHLSLGRPGEVVFDENTKLPIHKECHLSRNGLSSKACRLSMIGYSFLVRASMNPTGWRSEFLAEFVQKHGHSVGTYLIGHGVPWWNRCDGFKTLDELVRWSRWCFIYERDSGKFTSVGKDIPHWDEAQESWRDYMACDHKNEIYGTFYTALYKQPRTKRGKTPKCDFQILRRTDGRCGLCFDTIQTDGPRGPFSGVSDHIFPDSKGGPDSIENIQALHNCCNKSKSSISGGHSPLAWMLGRFALNQLAAPDGFKTWKLLAHQTYKAFQKFDRRI